MSMQDLASLPLIFISSFFCGPPAVWLVASQ